jgi:tetratricopeptide (TPR) repeat protein
MIRLPLAVSVLPLGTGLWLLLLCGTSLGATSIPQLVENGEYRQAVVELREQEARKPRDAKIKRNLGIALHQAGEVPEAIVKLREAQTLNPRDATTLFQLGMAAESAGDLRLALWSYGAYLERTNKNEAAVRARMQRLTQQSARIAVRLAIAQEHTLTLDPSATNTVAVPEFHAPLDSDTLRPLARGLATILMTDLGRVPDLRVVERARLRALQDELKLAEAHGVVDPKSTPRLGRLLAARRFAQGSLVPVGDSRLQLDALLVDARDASARTAGEPVSGDVTEVLTLEKRLVFHVIDSLGIVLTPELRRSIGEPPTRSFPAFLAFSRGVEFEDRGMPDLALAAYREAAQIDPQFQAARTRRDQLSVTPADQAGIEELSVRYAFATSNTAGRLMQSGTELGLPTVPFSETSGMTPAAKTGTIPLTIKGQVP